MESKNLAGNLVKVMNFVEIKSLENNKNHQNAHDATPKNSKTTSANKMIFEARSKNLILNFAYIFV